MKLYDFLKEAYSSESHSKSVIKYAYKYLSYLDKGNPLLQTQDIHYYGKERLNILTGNEVLEKGFYTLWTGAHDGIELLQRFDSYEGAFNNKCEWDSVKFSECDNCFMKEIV